MLFVKITVSFVLALAAAPGLAAPVPEQVYGRSALGNVRLNEGAAQ